MARLPRLTLAGYPHHIIQRGNNRQAIFSTPADYAMLLALLDQHAREERVAIYGYVLMPNHFHLLATPDSAAGIPRLMQAVGRRYVRHFNASQGRTGTLWEGRYRSTLIEAEPYLLPCLVYLDLNPVRHQLVNAPADYPWSSHAHYAGLRPDRLVAPPPQYWSLGNTPFSREAAYVEMVQAGIPPALERQLTASALRGWVLGQAQFLDGLQAKTQRRLSIASPGRPRTRPRQS